MSFTRAAGDTYKYAAFVASNAMKSRGQSLSYDRCTGPTFQPDNEQMRELAARTDLTYLEKLCEYARLKDII